MEPGSSCPTGVGQSLAAGTRFQIEVDDLEMTVAELRKAGAGFRGDIITGTGGKQILLRDPAGNLIELFPPFPLVDRLARSGDLRLIRWPQRPYFVVVGGQVCSATS